MHILSHTHHIVRTLAAGALALCLCGSCEMPKPEGVSHKPLVFVPDVKAEAQQPASRKSTTAQSRTVKKAEGEKSNPRLLEMPKTRKGEIIVHHTGFCLSYNTTTNCPNWVAWELTSDEASARAGRNPDFYADPAIEERSQVTTRDYTGSGYDRGHMCPAADMKWSTEAQHDCFYMSNICPQDHNLNSKSWERLENACRRWATREGSVYIACGPIFKEGRKARTIGRDHKVRVPDGFFKVVLSLRKGQEKAIGFYYANNDRQQDMEAAATTVDEIEKMTGYDFFYQIDKGIEKRVEARSNLQAWE